jgi:hypothetical protein
MTRANIRVGWDEQPGQHERHVDLNLSNASFLSARGGYFHDRYTDTGIRAHVVHVLQLEQPTPRCRPATCRAHKLYEHAERADHRFRYTKRSNFNVDYNQRSPPAGSTR